MANMGDGEQGSQFFITLDTTEELTRTHTLFGRVRKRMVFKWNRYMKKEKGVMIINLTRHCH